MGEQISIDKSDLLKILDALRENMWFHQYRDKMNAKVHLAQDVRYSPLTSTTISAFERLRDILKEE